MSRPRILVTGASGFVASHLVPRLDELGFEVTGTAPAAAPAWLPHGSRWHRADLREPNDFDGLLQNWWGVVHLAAQSVPSGFGSIAPLLENVEMTVNLLEHVRDCRFLCVSSCHVYAPSSVPVEETAPIRPHGRYGLSKHLTEQATLAFADRLSIRIARPFNHLGRNMPPDLLAPSLIARAAAGRGLATPLRMSGIDSTRDFLDVRDVVSAYVSILQIDLPTEPVFNVCSGIPVRVRDLAKIALEVTGSKRDVAFADEPRSGDDVPYIVGCPSRLVNATGWKPVHVLEESLRWMLAGSEA